MFNVRHAFNFYAFTIKLCNMNWSEMWNQAAEFSIEIHYYFISDDKWKIEITSL